MPEDTTEMSKVPINAARAAELASNLSQVLSRISSTTKTHQISKPIRLIAVSKLKPASDILALHLPSSSSSSSPQNPETDSQQQPPPPPPHVHFGENYVQELVEKSRLLPQSINWHFIGGLQSNKCRDLARDVPNLWAVESVDSIKKANLLNKGREEASETSEKKLRVFVQVNTSGEESKSGVEPKSKELLELARHVRGDECASLQLQGLMTIGAIARSQATTEDNENEDFVALRENRDWLVKELGMEDGNELELSMGMSEDFEGAIVQGSDEVRVGSTIFGQRPPKKEAKVLENTEEEKK